MSSPPLGTLSFPLYWPWRTNYSLYYTRNLLKTRQNTTCTTPCDVTCTGHIGRSMYTQCWTIAAIVYAMKRRKCKRYLWSSSPRVGCSSLSPWAYSTSSRKLPSPAISWWSWQRQTQFQTHMSSTHCKDERSAYLVHLPRALDFTTRDTHLLGNREWHKIREQILQTLWYFLVFKHLTTTASYFQTIV